jgi:hypothetical protein
MNHVQLIRKRFEELNLASDIDSLVNLRDSPLRDKESRPFKRSATLIEFSSSSRNREFQTSPEIQQKDKPFNFERQHSNNSNSSYKSVRRSQAFRLDVDKPNLAKSSSPTTSKLRRQNAIKYNFSPNKTQFDELQYLASSETIKKALKQPLPEGPAPKKPPRTFAASPKTSPINDDNNLLRDLEKITNQFASNNVRISVNNIDNNRNRTLPKTADKKDDKKGISSFLNCIISPCSIDPIYYEQIRHERKLNSKENEDIYMEPYEHLSHMNNSADANNKTELHYLCTNLIDQTNNNTSINSPIDIDRSFLDSNKDSSDIESYEKVDWQKLFFACFTKYFFFISLCIIIFAFA